MMVMVTKVIQVIHRLVRGRRRRMVPLVGVLRVIQEMVIVMTGDEHRGGGSLRWRWVGVERRRGSTRRRVWSGRRLRRRQLICTLVCVVRVQVMGVGSMRQGMRMREMRVRMIGRCCQVLTRGRDVCKSIRRCRRFCVVVRRGLVVIVIVVVLQVVLKPRRRSLWTCYDARCARFFTFAVVLVTRRFLVH
jgi:hypothetical protein